MKRKKQKRGMLTIHDKRMLKKPAVELKADEKAQLKKLFNELPCFDEISPVRNCKDFREIYPKWHFFRTKSWSFFVKNLSVWLNFSTMKKNVQLSSKVIQLWQLISSSTERCLNYKVKKSSVFEILFQVVVSKKVFNEDTKQNESKHLKMFSSGEFFGHVGLIYNEPRNATVVSLSRLIINKLCICPDDCSCEIVWRFSVALIY